MNRDILMWIQNGSVVKGEIDFAKGTVVFFDRFSNILMRRTGLSEKQLKDIRSQIQKQINKREHIGFYYINKEDKR